MAATELNGFSAQSFRPCDGYIVSGSDPLGRNHCWFGMRLVDDVESGSDRR